MRKTSREQYKNHPVFLQLSLPLLLCLNWFIRVYTVHVCLCICVQYKPLTHTHTQVISPSSTFPPPSPAFPNIQSLAITAVPLYCEVLAPWPKSDDGCTHTHTNTLVHARIDRHIWLECGCHLIQWSCLTPPSSVLVAGDSVLSDEAL